MKTSDIKLISIDLFRTLVDVDLSLQSIWKIFLREDYTNELGEKYWNMGTEILLEKLYTAAMDHNHFKNTREIYEDTYTTLFKEIGLKFDPKSAAQVLIEGHRLENFFGDAKPFLDTVGKKYPVCLSTDCDLEMITEINRLYPFTKVFVSEELQSYKLNPEFFSYVVGYYQLNPENILHIGDSYADIVVPKQLGMLTCWLNRDNKEWLHEIRPDFEVKSLLEVIDILERVASSD